MTVTAIQLPGERRVRHLTLIREPRSITPAEFNALTAEERLDIIGRALGRKKYRLLLEAADAADLVPRLPAQELYLLTRELGLADTADLVPLLSAEQFTTCLDLDAWDRDQLDGNGALGWLRALLDAGDEAVLKMVLEMDFELLVLILKKHLRVLSGPEDIEDEDVRAEAQRRDGGYQFEYFDSENAKLVAGLLDILLRADGDFFREVVEAVRWEAPAELEESVYRQRGIRLAEQGFPDPLEARSVYAWLDPAALDGEEGKIPLSGVEEAAAPPVFFLAAAGPRDLLGEALAVGVEEQTTWELTFLLNKVMMAEGVDLGEFREVQAATETVYRYLNLALEHLAGDDVEKAVRLLETRYLEHLFRAGFSLTLQLQRRARTIADSPVGPFLDGPFRALVRALLQTKPVVFEGLDDPEKAGERPFTGRRDLEKAAAWLDDLETQEKLFSGPLAALPAAVAKLDLAGCVPEDRDDVTLSDLFLTSLANRLLGGEFQPRPIPRRQLAALQPLVCGDRKVHQALRDENRNWLDSLVPGAGSFGDYCLDVWQEEFCALTADELDPRFFGGLIMRLAD